MLFWIVVPLIRNIGESSPWNLVQQRGVQCSKHSLDRGLVIRMFDGRVLSNYSQLKTCLIEARAVVLLRIIDDHPFWKSERVPRINNLRLTFSNVPLGADSVQEGLHN